MLRRIARLLARISDWSGVVSGWMVFVLMALILVEVITRYVMQNPLAVADEMGGYTIVALTFIGLGYTWKERGHVRVEFLINTLSSRNRKTLRVVTVAIATAFAGVLVFGCWEFVTFTIQFKQHSNTWLRVPLQWPQMMMIIGAVLLFLQLIAEFLLTINALWSEEGG